MRSGGGSTTNVNALCVRNPMGLEVKPDLSSPSNRGGFFNDGWAYLAIGVDVDGRKHALGCWIKDTEGAKF